MSCSLSHGIAVLRYTGIFVNISNAHSVNSSLFTTWDDFYQWLQSYTSQHPTERFYVIGCGDGYQPDAPFRIEWFGEGVLPEENRSTCTLSRWNNDTQSFVEITSETTHSMAKSTFDRLHFIYCNGTDDHRTAIATFNIDAVFINPDGTAF